MVVRETFAGVVGSELCRDVVLHVVIKAELLGADILKLVLRLVFFEVGAVF